LLFQNNADKLTDKDVEFYEKYMWDKKQK
jgi:hypothetical protein